VCTSFDGRDGHVAAVAGSSHSITHARPEWLVLKSSTSTSRPRGEERGYELAAAKLPVERNGRGVSGATATPRLKWPSGAASSTLKMAARSSVAHNGDNLYRRQGEPDT